MLERGQAEHRRRPEVLREDDADVNHRAQHRDHHAAAAILQAARAGYGQNEERCEVAVDPPGHENEARDDQRIARQLDVDHPSETFRPAQREEPQHVERKRGADENEERFPG
jgi:hypothetical protein